MDIFRHNKNKDEKKRMKISLELLWTTKICKNDTELWISKVNFVKFSTVNVWKLKEKKAKMIMIAGVDSYGK